MGSLKLGSHRLGVVVPDASPSYNSGKGGLEAALTEHVGPSPRPPLPLSGLAQDVGRLAGGAPESRRSRSRSFSEDLKAAEDPLLPGVATPKGMATSARASTEGEHPSRPPRRDPPARPMPRLLTVDQVAEYLAVCSRTVRRRIVEGELTVHRIGRSLRIAEDDLRRYLAGARES
jgi:excisionase family DNA binding protein